MNKHIPFNKPYFTGKETEYIRQAVASGKISGDGEFTKKCHQFFEQKFGFKKVLLTSSCTDALEMAAILLDIKEGDEIIAPAYTFVSTVNAFVLRGAKIVFADSQENHPNLDASKVEALITLKTKAIVLVHYAGYACDMDKIMALAYKYKLFVVEDAAQAVDSFYKGADGIQRPLGSIGHLAAFSFHETKNVIAGEGGMLVINDEEFIERAEVIREKGTNRSKFFRGEVDKYSWVDIGSSFLPSDIIAAFLFAQLENMEDIQKRRKYIWNKYNTSLNVLEKNELVQLPVCPTGATNNAHMFYLVCKNLETRSALIEHLKADNINAVFHYLSLHKSPFYSNKWGEANELIYSDYFTNGLVRLPLFYEMDDALIERVINSVLSFFKVGG